MSHAELLHHANAIPRDRLAREIATSANLVSISRSFGRPSLELEAWLGMLETMQAELVA